MDLQKPKDRDIRKLAAYIYNAINTKLELAGVEIEYGSVSVTTEFDEGAFFPHEVHMTINGKYWLSICGKKSKLLSAHAAKDIWEEMHKRATEELLNDCAYLAKAKSSDVKKITDYIKLGCKSNKKLPLLRITYGTVLTVPIDIDAPHFNSKIQLLLNGTYSYAVDRKDIINHIPSIAEKIWARMRTLAENEFEKQGGHRINGQRFKRQFVQSYPPSGKF